MFMTDSNSNDFELSGISKSYQGHQVLSGLSLSLKAGEPTLLLGANGSGKSTLLRISTQLARADSGKILISSRPASREHLPTFGYFGHEMLMYGNLTVSENFELLRKILKLDVKLDDYSSRWNLGRLENKRLVTLSKGQQARVALAKTFLHSPSFIFLDEPTASLDDVSFELFMSNMANYLEQAVVPPVLLIASHDVTRMAEWSQRILVINSMKIAADSGSKGSDSVEKSKEDAIAYYRETLH